MSSKEQKDTQEEQQEEDWTNINTGLGFSYQRGVRFTWSPLVEDVKGLNDYTYQRGARFRSPSFEKIRKTRSQRRKEEEQKRIVMFRNNRLRRRLAVLKSQFNM